jgi:hypothetical protein
MDYDTLNVRRLFPQVWHNGYTPLPNLDKRCRLLGWSTVQVDARQISLWSRQTRWPAMGIRIEPPLAVLDIDVLEPELVAQIEELMPVRGLARIGQLPKIAYFVRWQGEPKHRLATRRWSPDPDAEKPRWSAVEIFAGGGRAKQVGSFGPHKLDEASGTVLSTYRWPGASPLDTPLDTLPVLTCDQAFTLIDTAEQCFRDAGMQVDQLTRKGEHHVDQVFDLADQIFEGDGEDYDLAGLEIAAQAAQVTGAQLRVTGSFTGDRYSSRSLRCRVGISHFDRVYVHDFKTGLTHHPADAATADDNGGGRADFSDLLRLVEEHK